MISACTCHDMGDHALLAANLEHVHSMFGDNCIVYVLSHDASHVSVSNPSNGVVSIDYLHRIALSAHHDISRIRSAYRELLDYDPRDESNLDYATLHHVFMQVDVLHIVGGPHLSAHEPEVVEELLAAVRLARLHDVRVIATGLSLHPRDELMGSPLSEIIASCALVDFAEGGLEGLNAQFAGSGTATSEVIQTTDDAAFLRPDPIVTSRYGSRPDIRAATDGSYLNIGIRGDATASLADRWELVLHWAEGLISSGTIDHVNLLGMHDEAELDACRRLIEAHGADPDRFLPLSLVGKPVGLCQHIISHAAYNVATHYHQAVFSLAAGVPTLCLAIGEDDSSRFASLFDSFGTAGCHRLDDCTLALLSSFVTQADAQRGELVAGRIDVEDRWRRKMRGLSKAYADDEGQAETLFQRLGPSPSPLVSVIIPIYNMDRYLRTCLDSVLGQTLRDIEVICVDDGSSDDTAAILVEYAWRDGRIRVISQKNAGVSAARNEGLRSATGEYVFFLDPDDWLATPRALATLYWAAKTHGALASCGNFLEAPRNGAAPLVTHWESLLCGYSMPREGMVDYRDFQFDIGWIRFLYHRDALIRCAAWFPHRTFYEDPVWFVRVMDSFGSFYATTAPIYCYRTGHKSGELSYRQVVDLLNGMADNLAFAAERGYERLWTLTYERLTKEYASRILTQLLPDSNRGKEMEEALARLGKLVCPGGDGAREVERAIFSGALGDERMRHEEAVKVTRDEAAQAKEREFRSSHTWKAGSLLLWAPKRIKGLLESRHPSGTTGGSNG